MNNKFISRRDTLSLLAASMIGLALRGPDGKKYEKIKSKNQNNSSMKTIGIIGGIGPQATMDLEMRIHKTAQQLIRPQENSGYPPLIVQYYRHAPILLLDNHQPVLPFQVDPRLLDMAKNIGNVADFILIASNGIHLFQKEIEKAAGREVFSMIDATVNQIKSKNWKKVGVLGLMNANIYIRPLQASGIICETIDNDLQQRLNSAIFKVMEGKDGEAEIKIAIEAIEQLRNKNVDGIIPGCTEIPFLLKKEMNAVDIINPIQILAEAAVKYSMVNGQS
jgi:aspartate racemase